MSEHTGNIHRGRVERQQKFFDAVQQTHSVWQACEKIGISKRTYDAWRRRYPKFRRKADVVLGRIKPEDADFDGGFVDWRRTYLTDPDGNPMETFEHQAEIAHQLENAPMGSTTLILLPPGCGKTTTLEDYIGYTLSVKDRNHRFGVISKNQNHARKTIGRLKRVLTDPSISKELIDDYGPFHVKGQERNGKPWRANYFTVWGAEGGSREYSVAAHGWGSQIYGARWNTIIIDDPQDIDSLNQTDDLLAKFRQDIRTRLPPGNDGRIFIIMTRVGEGDFAQALLDEGIVDRDRLVRIRALDSNGESNMPELFSTQDFEDIRDDMGPEIWARNYMQRPTPPGTSTFDPDDMKNCRNELRKLGEPVDVDESYVIFGMDPAIGSGSRSGMIALQAHSDGLALLDVQARKGVSRTEQLVQWIDEWAGLYEPSVVVIEVNAFQKSLSRNDALREAKSKHGFQIIEHTTHRNKADSDFGVASSASAFTRSDVDIPWADKPTRRRMREFVEEAKAWRPGVRGDVLDQDLVMCWWFAWKYYSEHHTKGRVQRDRVLRRSRHPKFTPTPYGPLSATARRN